MNPSLDQNTQTTIAWTWDAFGHCTNCQLADVAIAHLDALLATGKAQSYAANPVCGHVMLYRTLARW